MYRRAAVAILALCLSLQAGCMHRPPLASKSKGDLGLPPIRAAKPTKNPLVAKLLKRSGTSFDPFADKLPIASANHGPSMPSKQTLGMPEETFTVNRFRKLGSDQVAERDPGLPAVHRGEWRPVHCPIGPEVAPAPIYPTHDTTERRSIQELWEAHQNGGGFVPNLVLFHSEPPLVDNTLVAHIMEYLESQGVTCMRYADVNLADVSDFRSTLVFTNSNAFLKVALRDQVDVSRGGVPLDNVMRLAYFEKVFTTAEFARGLRMFRSFYHDADDLEEANRGGFLWSHARAYIQAYANGYADHLADEVKVKTYDLSPDLLNKLLRYHILMVITTTEVTWGMFLEGIRSSVLESLKHMGAGEQEDHPKYVITFPDVRGKSNCWVSQWFAHIIAKNGLPAPEDYVPQSKLRKYRRWRKQNGMEPVNNYIIADDNSCSGEQLDKNVNAVLAGIGHYQFWTSANVAQMTAGVEDDERPPSKPPRLIVLPLFSTDAILKRLAAPGRRVRVLPTVGVEHGLALDSTTAGMPSIVLLRYRVLKTIAEKLDEGGLSATTLVRLGVQKPGCEDCTLMKQVSTRLDWKIVDYLSQPLRFTLGLVAVEAALSPWKGAPHDARLCKGAPGRRFIRSACPPYKNIMSEKSVDLLSNCMGAETADRLLESSRDPGAYFCDMIEDNLYGESFLFEGKIVAKSKSIASLCRDHHGMDMREYIEVARVPDYCDDPDLFFNGVLGQGTNGAAQESLSLPRQAVERTPPSISVDDEAVAASTGEKAETILPVPPPQVLVTEFDTPFDAALSPIRETSGDSHIFGVPSITVSEDSDSEPGEPWESPLR